MRSRFYIYVDADFEKTKVMPDTSKLDITDFEGDKVIIDRSSAALSEPELAKVFEVVASGTYITEAAKGQFDELGLHFEIGDKITVSQSGLTIWRRIDTQSNCGQEDKNSATIARNESQGSGPEASDSLKAFAKVLRLDDARLLGHLPIDLLRMVPGLTGQLELEIVDLCKVKFPGNVDLPSILGRIPVHAFEWSVRAQNYFIANNIQLIEDLLSKELVEIESSRNVGKKTAQEIVSVVRRITEICGLEDTFLVTGMRDDSELSFWGTENLDSKQASLKLKNFEFSTRVTNRLAELGLETIGDLLTTDPAELLRTKNLGRKSLEEIANFLKSVGETNFFKSVGANAVAPLANLSNLTTDVVGEYAAAAAGTKWTEKQFEEFISRRLGVKAFSGRPHTLEDLGSQHGVTRERIRQIEQKAWRKLLARPTSSASRWRARLAKLMMESSLPLELATGTIKEAIQSKDDLRMARALLRQRYDKDFEGTKVYHIKIRDREYLYSHTQQEVDDIDQFIHQIFKSGVGRECGDLKKEIYSNIPKAIAGCADLLYYMYVSDCVLSEDSPEGTIIAFRPTGKKRILAERCIRFIQEYGEPITNDEIAQFLECRPEEIRGVVNYFLSDNRIFPAAHGQWNVLSNLNIAPGDKSIICDFGKNLLRDKTQFHSREVLELSPYLKGKFSYFDIAGILKDTEKFRYLGRSVFAALEAASESRINIRDTIVNILHQHGRPMSLGMIREELQKVRSMGDYLQVSVGEPIIKVGTNYYALSYWYD